MGFLGVVAKRLDVIEALERNVSRTTLSTIGVKKTGSGINFAAVAVFLDLEAIYFRPEISFRERPAGRVQTSDT